ncbi:hypothetical protein D3C71_1688490 [compost metagenome]
MVNLAAPLDPGGRGQLLCHLPAGRQLFVQTLQQQGGIHLIAGLLLQPGEPAQILDGLLQQQQIVGEAMRLASLRA